MAYCVARQGLYFNLSIRLIQLASPLDQFPPQNLFDVRHADGASLAGGQVGLCQGGVAGFAAGDFEAAYDNYLTIDAVDPGYQLLATIPGFADWPIASRRR